MTSAAFSMPDDRPERVSTAASCSWRRSDRHAARAAAELGSRGRCHVSSTCRPAGAGNRAAPPHAALTRRSCNAHIASVGILILTSRIPARVSALKEASPDADDTHVSPSIPA